MNESPIVVSSLRVGKKFFFLSRDNDTYEILSDILNTHTTKLEGDFHYKIHIAFNLSNVE